MSSITIRWDSPIPGTPLPATASAVSASRPKRFAIQAEAKPSAAAASISFRSCFGGAGSAGVS
jgi:hypothetical protein